MHACMQPYRGLLPALTLAPTPRCMEQLNLVTSVEMMKNDALIRDVVKLQQSRKHRTAMQVLRTPPP